MNFNTLIKNIIKYVIRNIPVDIIVLFLKNKIKYSKSNKNKIKILVLNYERFPDDVNTLSENDSVEIVIFNSKLQAFLNALWISEIRNTITDWRNKNYKVPYNKIYFTKKNKKIVDAKNKLTNYLKKLIIKLQREIKFDFIMTCAVWYIQDKEWEKACENIKIPFISIHKECMFDKSVIEKEILEKKKMNCETYNSKVILYNETAKEVLVKSGIAKSENCYVFGSMRMDNLYRLSQFSKLFNKKNILIFSFTHRAGLLNFVKQNANKNFSNIPEEGFYKLFDNFHGTIAELAIKYANLNFTIKVKWEYVWIDKIENSIFKHTNKFSKDIPNLKIVVKKNVHDLIFESDVVIGFNSSTLVESVVLKKPVIVPLFDEASENDGCLYKDHVYFKDYLDQFNIARSPKEIEIYINKMISGKYTINKTDHNFVNYYIGKVDGKCRERLLNYLNDIKNNTI